MCFQKAPVCLLGVECQTVSQAGIILSHMSYRALQTSLTSHYNASLVSTISVRPVRASKILGKETWFKIGRSKIIKPVFRFIALCRVLTNFIKGNYEHEVCKTQCFYETLCHGYLLKNTFLPRLNSDMSSTKFGLCCVFVSIQKHYYQSWHCNILLRNSMFGSVHCFF